MTPMTNEEIRTLMLANGFTIKEGLTDLKPYVYQAARAIEAHHGTVPPTPLPLEERENRPLRCFLSAFGQPGLTVGAMKDHLQNHGYPYWPTWAGRAEEHDQFLSKGGAQFWIRHLLALESQPAINVLAILKEMVAMMESGDEHGEGSEWHRRARAAIGAPTPAPLTEEAIMHYAAQSTDPVDFARWVETSHGINPQGAKE